MSLIDRRSAPLPGPLRAAFRVKDILRHAASLDHQGRRQGPALFRFGRLLPLSPSLLAQRVLFRPHLDYVGRRGGSYPALIGVFSNFLDESPRGRMHLSRGGWLPHRGRATSAALFWTGQRLFLAVEPWANRPAVERGA